MAMNEPHEPLNDAGTEDDDTVLPCGRDLALLWDEEARDRRGTAGPDGDPHTTGCPHCTAALADLALLRDAALHRNRETGADNEADMARLTTSIMNVVRLELRPGHTLALGDTDEDSWIYEAAAARTFRAAAEQVPGVRAGSCRISPEPSPRADVRTPARVRIEVTIGMNQDLQPTADRVRASIAKSAEQALGLRITSIDVVVIDLHDEPTTEDPR
ncbi:Asp23/Gls24 family envelope stress response protein [Streptomyces sp. NPDC057939]|uniref:Asp23/Gls24 family envelope stress response protein n=1 Tax=Streptomyces sp. NPDC057939 TaxID=3346284 RepID=UPI0036E26EC3